MTQDSCAWLISQSRLTESDPTWEGPIEDDETSL